MTDTDLDEDPTQARDREIVESEEQARSAHLADLARRCDNTVMREDAIGVLDKVIDAHTHKDPPWVKRL